MTTPLFNQSQFWARADAGGEGGVIFDSSIALIQGLFPPTVRYHLILGCHSINVVQTANTISLANNTNVTSPFNGYQYVPIESVEPNEDVSLEGFTSCNVRMFRGTSLARCTELRYVDPDDPHDRVLQFFRIPGEGQRERCLPDFAAAISGRSFCHARQHGGFAIALK